MANHEEKPVLLRAKGEDKSVPFEPAHAKRLLAYPGTLWAEVAEESKVPVKTAGKDKPE